MSKFLVLDTETSINDPVHKGMPKSPLNDFYTVIWGTSPNSIHVQHKPAGAPHRALPRGFIKALHECKILIGANFQFDLSYIYHNKDFQTKLRSGLKIWCIQYAHYLMSGQRHAYPSLSEMQMYYLGEKVKESRISRLFARGIGADKIVRAAKRCPKLFALYEKYSRDDGETTLRIFQKQQKRAEALGMCSYLELMMDFLLSLVVMSNTGMYVDKHKTETTNRDFKLKAMELLEKAQALVAKYWTDERLPAFNINSTAHKSAVLFGGTIPVKVRRQDGFYKNGKEKFKNFEETVEITGFNLPRRLSSEGKFEGRYKTGDEIIHRIYNETDNEEAKEYCRLQKEAMNLLKMSNTYLEAFLSRSIDGKLYPEFNNCQTVTSRLSSSRPNLQNVPSKGEMGPIIQSLLVATEGWKAVGYDFSQLEVYIRAWMTGDTGLISDVMMGKDFHISWLSYSSGKSYEELVHLCKSNDEWASRRTKAKVITFQEAYGAGPNKMGESTGFDVEDIKQMLEGFYNEYPRIKEYRQEVLEQVMRRSRPLRKNMLATKMLKSEIWNQGTALLPIYDDTKTPEYRKFEERNVGYYQAPTGAIYSFLEVGRYDRRGALRRTYSSTEIANYPCQGGASVVMATAMVSIMREVLQNPDIQMVSTVHDSCWLYIKDNENFKDNCKKIKQCMESAGKVITQRLGCKLPFDFKCDIKYGENFGEMTSLDVDNEEQIPYTE